MAIGWMYREDYARGGIRLTPNLPNTHYAALSTVVQALFYAVLMIPVTLWPAALHITGSLYAVAATILSLGYLWYTIRFARIIRDPELPKPRASSPAISSAPPSSISRFS